MTLSTSNRSAIYTKLIPLLGIEHAEALMAEFPATEIDQLVTRDHLRAELSDLRTDVAELRTEMHALVNRSIFATVGAVIAGMGLATAIA